MAIQASLSETSTSAKSTSTPQSLTSQEEEDRALAQAIADSEKEARNRQGRQQTVGKRWSLALCLFVLLFQNTF